MGREQEQDLRVDHGGHERLRVHIRRDNLRQRRSPYGFLARCDQRTCVALPILELDLRRGLDQCHDQRHRPESHARPNARTPDRRWPKRGDRRQRKHHHPPGQPPSYRCDHRDESHLGFGQQASVSGHRCQRDGGRKFPIRRAWTPSRAIRDGWLGGLCADGPAKGKDFSTVIGPWLVTPDELSPFLVPAKQGHVGNNYNLSMKCWVNDVLVSEGNVKDMDWTFAEIIERCSYGVTIFPGDVIGSGTVGTGCFLELNGTGKLHDPNYQPQWLQANDTVKMTIDGLGTLVNTIKAEATDWSILALKK